MSWKQAIKWIWKCPKQGCEATSMKAISRYKVARNGRIHLKKQHGEYSTDPILEKVIEDCQQL